MTSTARLSFRLDEAFYQFLLHNGDVVTLSLAVLRAEAQSSFLYLPETSLHDGTNTREIDAAALVDGRLFLIEAKSNARVSNGEVGWYRHLAIKSRASTLAFSGTESQWEPTWLGRLSTLEDDLQTYGISVRRLTRTDLIPFAPELQHFSRRRTG